MPGRWRNPSVGIEQRERHGGITRAEGQADGVIPRAGELRIEIDVGGVGGIEQFGVQQDAAVRPDIAHEQRLSPAAMSNDEIRPETFMPQRPQNPGDRRATGDAVGIVFGQRYVRPSVQRIEPVGPHRDDVWKLVAFRHDSQQLVTGVPPQCGRNMKELTGEILVQEQDAHAGLSDIGRHSRM